MGRSIYLLALHHICILTPDAIILGRQGIGLSKRARSPSAAERLAKMAKMAEDMDHRDFRERARDDYNNRRAEDRLGVYPIARRFILNFAVYTMFNFALLCFFFFSFSDPLAPAQLTCATLDEQMEKSVSFFPGYDTFYNGKKTSFIVGLFQSSMFYG